MTSPDASRDIDQTLRRIERALERARVALLPFTSGDVDHTDKNEGGKRWDPLTEADLAVDRCLREVLPEEGEGWLSEETRDDRTRLDCRRVWIVDPVDGTREFVQGVPEWCVSVGLVEDGVPVAGGILNPATDELVLGGEGRGVTLNGEPVDGRRHETLAGAVVLASRSETARGEWDRYADASFVVKPCGSVAYKLGLVAAGRADATWTLVPKNEWDVAAGAALCRAAGLVVVHADGTERRFNAEDTLMPNFLAGPAGVVEAFRRQWLDEEATP